MKSIDEVISSIGSKDQLKLTSGALHSIASERLRQIEKGYDIDHDLDNAENDPDCLIDGAIYYLKGANVESGVSFLRWPYDSARPIELNYRKCLVKAAAMLLACIEVMDENSKSEDNVATY